MLQSQTGSSGNDVLAGDKLGFALSVINKDSEVLSRAYKDRVTTLGFTADPFTDGVKITVAGIEITLEEGGNGNDVALQVQSAFKKSSIFKDHVVERVDNTILLIAPVRKSIAKISSQMDMGGVNIDLTVDAPSGWVDGIWYGENPYFDVISKYTNPYYGRITTLGFTADPFNDGVRVNIAGIEVTLKAGSSGNDVARQVQAAFKNSSIFKDHLVERVDNTLLLVAPVGKIIAKLSPQFDMGGVNIDLTVDAPSGWVDGVWYGLNPFDDTLRGGAGNDLIYGDVGNDFLDGGGGNDTLAGGSDVDTLVGGSGADRFVLLGNDTVNDFNSKQSDAIDASGLSINDTVTFVLVSGSLNMSLTAAAVRVSGASTAATIATGAGADSLIGGAGADSLSAGAGNDTLNGGVGNDTLIGGLGDDSLAGGAGNDTYFVDSSADVITEFSTNSGIDVVQVVATSYVMSAYLENLIFTGLGNFIGFGNDLSNSLTGGASADSLSGGLGNDSINAGKGVDTLTGGKGFDRLSGGTGSDTFVFSAGDSEQASGGDIILDFAKGAVNTGDLIDYVSDLVIGGSSDAATATQALINQNSGVATFAAKSGSNLADALADIAARFTSAGDATGEIALFRVAGKGNHYLFISDGTAGVTANDVLVQLVGVTSVTSIDLTGGNLTITG